MHKKIIIPGILALIVGCSPVQNPENSSENMTQSQTKETNPLLVKSTLPYGAPHFDRIKNEDYQPAIEKSMRLQIENIQKITAENASPTFENTVLALERSGDLLENASGVFYAMTSAHTNDAIKKIQADLAPLMARHSDEIYLNEKLFSRVKAVYDNVAHSGLDAESKKLTEEYYKDFVQAGANLSASDKEKLKSFNAELATLQTQFNQTLQNANNSAKITVTDRSLLEGLSDAEIDALKNDKGSYAISILNTTQQPLFSSLKNRNLRQQLFEASWNRTNGGEFDTNNIIVQLAKLRDRKAELLGFKNYAEWSLVNTMVQNPATVRNFFDGMISAVRKKGAEEENEIKK